MTVGELVEILKGYDGHLPVTAMNASVFRDTPREIREVETEDALPTPKGFEIVHETHSFEEDCETIIVLRF